MESIRKPISSLEDIRQIESRPYREAVPLTSTYDIFIRAAERFGDKAAILQLFSGNPDEPARKVSFRGLLDQIRRAANLFRSLGVGASDAVVILLPHLPESHYALWGSEVAGRACPINYMLSTEHIAELVEAANAKVIVALGPDPDFEIWTKALAVASRCKGLALLRVGDREPDSFESKLARQPSELQFDRRIDAHDVAAYYHTGGTTGAPKLAQHTHGNEVHTSWFAGMFYGLTEHDLMVNGFPLFHVAGAFVCGASAFCAGTTLLLPPRLGMRHREFVANYWRFVEKYSITYLAAVPTVVAALLNVPVANSDIDTVKALYVGGSPLPTELANAFESETGIPVRNILGMTESAGLVSIEPLAAPRTAQSCGIPLPFTEVFAVPMGNDGPRLSERCPPNTSGVIVLRGPHVSPGYSDSRRNAGMFAEDGMLISGDLGHIDQEGRVFITGRAKDVIIRGAHNIDPSMIEEAFAAHPEVQMCAAVGEPDTYAGELPVVFVVLQPDAKSSIEQILSEVGQNIAEPAAIPKRITALDMLPTTAIGKIYKPGLRILAIEQAFGDALSDVRNTCRRLVVKALETPGGLLAEISVSTDNPDRASEAIKAALGRFATPYRVNWL